MKNINLNKTSGFGISNTLYFIGSLLFIIGFIAGIKLGEVEVVKGVYTTYTVKEFSFGVAIIYWASAFISGMLFIAFGKIIDLLTDIKNKL